MTADEEHNWGMFAHLTSFAGSLIPFGNIVGPLIIWQIKKDESEYVSRHGKAALNFQISMMIWLFISALLCLVFIGFVMLFALLIVNFVYVIINCINASKEKRRDIQ